MRTILNFNDNWLFSKTDAIPDILPASWEQVTLPHTWNAEDGQDGGNDYWRGTAVYCKEFDRPVHEGAVVLEFLGAAMVADVYVNGQHLAHHEGGYSTFRVDITSALQEKNLLCVAVDNAPSNRVYPQKADFTFYGGLYRSVNLILVPEQHFELCKDGTPGMKITPVVAEDLSAATVTVETWQNGEGNVTVEIAGESKTSPSVDGYASLEFVLNNVHLWNGVKDPYLYTAKATFGEDEISLPFGCRTIAFDAEKGFFLNGKSYPLRGVSRHQDRKGLGNALTLKEHEEDMEIIRSLGANTIRLAHYQHAQEFYDLCDRYGMVVWAEIPYITLHMPLGRENTLSQMRELVTQCYHHPSVVCWGLSNEITAASTVNEDLLENHRLLNDLCHRMDSTRPTTMAHVFMLEQDSPLIPIADIGSYNLYFGWYIGEPEQNDSFFDSYHSKFPNRVIGFSEYGADANPQFQSAHPEKGDYTESYQCLYHEHILQCIEERPYLWATHVWNMFDFAADGRDEGGTAGVNQKGLVTMDRKLKKDAYFLYKAHWSDEPFVHLCGRRYADRAEEVTEVKVYTNQPTVSLYVDGILFAEEKADRIVRFSVPIKDTHTVEVRSGELSDTMTIRKVDAPNPEYRLAGSEPVTNWFDEDTYDPTCFSIRDTMGELMAHPKAGAILGRMMDAARSTRGDVAEATAGNESLMRMMAGMSLQNILKQAGPSIKAEQIQGLNKALQQIKKS